MNVYEIVIRRVGDNLIQFFVVMNGKLLDVQEWPVRTSLQKRRCREALAQYGLKARIHWNVIECMFYRGKDRDWRFAVGAHDALNCYHGWPKVGDPQLSNAPKFIRNGMTDQERIFKRKAFSGDIVLNVRSKDGKMLIDVIDKKDKSGYSVLKGVVRRSETEGTIQFYSDEEEL